MDIETCIGRPMIIDTHPDNSSGWAPDNNKHLKYIGYWTSPDYEAEGVILPHPKFFVVENFDPKEKAMIINYLNSHQRHNAWMGESFCRFRCGETAFFKSDYVDMGALDFTDGTFVWPQGFAHYVDIHNVRPPEEFIYHISSPQCRFIAALQK